MARRSRGRWAWRPPRARWSVLSVPLVSLMLLAALLVPATAGAVVVGLPAYLELVPTSQTLTVGTPAGVVAFVTDLAHQPVSGVQVQFSLGAGSVNPPTSPTTATTDVDGSARLYLSAVNPGTDYITATAVGTGLPPATATVTWNVASGNAISISPTSLTSSIGVAQTFTATVTDSSENPVAGASVTFTVSGLYNNLTSLAPPTGANGETTFSYTSSVAETDTVTASSPGISPAATATVTWIAPSSISITPTTLTATAGTSQTFTATVTDGSGNPVQGVTVNFSVTGANTSSGSGVTNSSGQVTFNYAGNAGTDTLTATIAGTSTSASATVTWVGAGAVTLRPTNPVAVVGSTLSIVATVTDTSNNPIPNLPVTFTVGGANSTSSTATTNSSGQATLSYVGNTAGTDTVTVAVSGLSSVSTTVRWVIGPLNLTLSASSGTPTVGTSATVTATLKDGSGNPISGVPVKFTATGANPGSSTATTNSSGQATFSYTGNTAGTDTIAAYADLNNNGTQDSGEPTGSVTITWSAAPPPSPSAFAPAQPAAPKAGCTYFAITHHNLCAGFQDYWTQFGGLAIYGYPLTEEFVENGVTVQYFERARFEWHPGAWPSHFDVLLGLVGDEVTAGRSTEAPFQATTAKPGCTYFAATGHNLCAGFGAYWNQFGGLAAYGMPISEEFQEKNPDTGQMYTVQYFERARFEWHPGEDPVHFDVELGRLGAQILAARYGVMY